MDDKLKPLPILAIRNDKFTVEDAFLFEDHFGKGKHAVRFCSDKMNSPFYAEKDIAWEYRGTRNE